MKRGSERGGVLAGVLAALGILVAAGVIAAVCGGVYLCRNVKVTEWENGARIETPFGTMRVNEQPAFNAAAAGLPVYPEARRLARSRTKRASIELDMPGSYQNFEVAVAEFATADSWEKVSAWYREQLPGWHVVSAGGGEAKIESTGRGSKRVIAIHRHGGETRIVLASVGEPAAN